MITALICSLALLLNREPQGQMMTKFILPATPNTLAHLFYQEIHEPMDPPHEAPKKFGADKVPWFFPWLVSGYCETASNASRDLRFQVFSQEQKGNRNEQVMRMLLRLWELNAERLGFDHNPDYKLGIVDVYLCFGGKAGGEQLLEKEFVPDPKIAGKLQVVTANTIYIYDLASFTDPIEMAREISHEYGHASLPPVGGFKEPEEWVDGYLAEKLSLRWLRDLMAKGEITPDDVMGATAADLDKWVKTNVDPLVLKSAQIQPTPELISDKSAAGMNAFIGLAMYIDTIYSDSIFINSMKFSGSVEAKDYIEGVLRAASAPEEITLRIPPSFFGHAIWLPLGKGKLTGAKILKFDKSGWVQVVVRNDPIVITNPQP